MMFNSDALEAAQLRLSKPYQCELQFVQRVYKARVILTPSYQLNFNSLGEELKFSKTLQPRNVSENVS